MWRQAGFVEMLVSPAKRDQNEMGGLQKRGRFKTFLNESKTRSLMMKARSLMMKKRRNLKNEIKTRWGDSINLLYCSHIINKSRRSHVGDFKNNFWVEMFTPNIWGSDHIFQLDGVWNQHLVHICLWIFSCCPCFYKVGPTSYTRIYNPYIHGLMFFFHPEISGVIMGPVLELVSLGPPCKNPSKQIKTLITSIPKKTPQTHGQNQPTNLLL